MILKMRVEQTNDYKNRVKYYPNDDSFKETEWGSIMYLRGFKGVYGWIEGMGTPPEKHLDIFLITDKKYSLGDRESVKVIGCFVRADEDHKIIAVHEECDVENISELSEEKSEMLKALYPQIGEGDGWVDKKDAINIIENF